jgi:hypothetical protein
MTVHSFSLMPFPDPALPGIEISGRIERDYDKLSIRFFLTGDIKEIQIPPAASRPCRADELWRATCFEFFLAIDRQPQYWEFNLSPSGNWNVYRMDAYRRVGFREEPLVEQLQLKPRRNVDCISLAADVDLSTIIPHGQIMQAGVTSIIQTRFGHETYWALSHPAPRPDFHLRKSFLLQL